VHTEFFDKNAGVVSHGFLIADGPFVPQQQQQQGSDFLKHFYLLKERRPLGFLRRSQCLVVIF
jgi:hypothetical protein